VILVFDAQCLLCDAGVQFVLRHDHPGRIQFASMQGQTGQQLLAQHGLRAEALLTVLLVDGRHSWQHTAALFRVMHALGWPWRLAWLGWLVPAFVRDPLYRLLAKNRYRFFGRSKVCILPPAHAAARFLD
jgi:predicted DCC family thiol-disulfide oxidoreductase YuxK